MPRRYSAKQVMKGLKRSGFVKVSQRGSHIKFRGIVDGKLQTAIVPNYKQLAPSIFDSIVRQSGLSKPTLENAIKWLAFKAIARSFDVVIEH